MSSLVRRIQIRKMKQMKVEKTQTGHYPGFVFSKPGAEVTAEDL